MARQHKMDYDGPKPGRADYELPEYPDLSGEKELYYDLETTGLQWWPASSGQRDKPTGYAVATKDRSWYFPTRQAGRNLDPDKTRRWLRSREGLAGKRLVGLNVKFDAHHSREDGVDLEEIGCSLADVGHYAALLDDYRRSFSLDSIAKDELGYGKVELDMSRGAGRYTAAEIEAYARGDVELVRGILAKQLPRMEAEGLTRVAAVEDECILATVEMERNGAPLDMEKLDDFCLESERELVGYLMRLKALVGFTANPSSSKDMERIFGKCGLPVVPTASGLRPSFTDDVLSRWEGREEIDLARLIRKLESLRSKFLLKYKETAERTNGILRYSLNQLKADEGGTVRGRYSSSALSGEEGANVQQVVRPSSQREWLGDRYIIRDLFVAGEGLLYDADAEQIEYRVFANRARPKYLLEQYKKDPWTNYHKFIIPMVQAIMEGGELKYQQGKTLNFSVLYAGGVKTVSEQLDVDEATARRFLAAYDRANPAARRAVQEASNEAERNGFVTTVLGRRARFRGKKMLHAALNAIIQGTAADFMKVKLVELFKARKALSLTLRMTVHDEVIGDVPDAEAAAKVTELLNVQSLPAEVPILWSGATGRNWTEAKEAA